MMSYRFALLTMMGVLLAAAPAQAERQVYNPYALGVTYYDLERAQAMKERRVLQAQMGLAGTDTRRRNRNISPEEQRQVLALEKKFKSRFPVHPGLYRDAYDRGGWKRRSSGGGNPGDRWW